MVFVWKVRGNCSTFSSPSLTLVFLLVSIPLSAAISKCHSCFSGCENVDECDCTSLDDDQTCQGEFCYVKLDRLTDNGLGSIRKGCTNWAPDNYVDVCQYVSNNNTIECYCQGDSCNNLAHLDHYRPKPLPLVSCCQCGGYDYQNETIDCLSDTCLSNCTGHYCYNDIVTQTQGCGWGYSLEWQFLRNTHHVDRPRPQNSTALLPYPWDKDGGGMTCTEAYSDIKTILRGCTCSYDSCNIENTANVFVRNETEIDPGDHYCYAVHFTSNKPITGVDAYKQSTTCPGHFCFVTLTTTVLSYGPSPVNGTLNSSLASDYWPKMVPTYELSAGCVLIDDDKKVETGCTTEWSQTPDKPTKKHCVCASHICNYFNLITGEDKRSLLAFDWKTSNGHKTVKAAGERRLASLWIVLAFVFVTFCMCLM